MMAADYKIYYNNNNNNNNNKIYNADIIQFNRRLLYGETRAVDRLGAARIVSGAGTVPVHRDADYLIFLYTEAASVIDIIAES